MSKAERLRGQRAVERGNSGSSGPDHVCLIDTEAKSTEVCKVCRAWWEPIGGEWVKINRGQRRTRVKEIRKAWANAARKA